MPFNKELKSVVEQFREDNERKVGVHIASSMPEFYYQQLQPWIDQQLESHGRYTACEQTVRQEALRWELDPDKVFASFEYGLEIYLKQKFHLAKKDGVHNRNMSDEIFTPKKIEHFCEAYAYEFIVMLRYAMRQNIHSNTAVDIAVKTYRNSLGVLLEASRTFPELQTWVLLAALQHRPRMFHHFLKRTTQARADLEDHYSPNQAMQIAVRYAEPQKRGDTLEEIFDRERRKRGNKIFTNNQLKEIIIRSPLNYLTVLLDTRNMIKNNINTLSEKYSLSKPFVKQVMLKHPQDAGEWLQWITTQCAILRAEFPQDYIKDFYILRALLHHPKSYRLILKQIRDLFPSLHERYSTTVSDTDILRLIGRQLTPDLSRLDTMEKNFLTNGSVKKVDYRRGGTARRGRIAELRLDDSDSYTPALETLLEIWGDEAVNHTFWLDHYEQVAKNIGVWQEHWKVIDKEQKDSHLPSKFYHREFINFIKTERSVVIPNKFVRLSDYLYSLQRHDLYWRVYQHIVKIPDLVHYKQLGSRGLVFAVDKKETDDLLAVIVAEESRRVELEEQGYIILYKFLKKHPQIATPYQTLRSAALDGHIPGFSDETVYKENVLNRAFFIHEESALERYRPLTDEEMFLQPASLGEVFPDYDEDTRMRIYRTTKTRVARDPDFISRSRHFGIRIVINKQFFVAWVNAQYGSPK